MLNNLSIAAALAFIVAGLPFVAAHIADTWNAPEYPHSGFSPECPTWEPENTLPPTAEQEEIKP